MLKDITTAKHDSRNTKRWIRDEAFDLYLWQTAAGEIVSLQLCCNRINNEHILSWSTQHGSLHARVDSPEDNPGGPCRPNWCGIPANLVREDFL